MYECRASENAFALRLLLPESAGHTPPCTLLGHYGYRLYSTAPHLPEAVRIAVHRFNFHARSIVNVNVVAAMSLTASSTTSPLSCI